MEQLFHHHRVWHEEFRRLAVSSFSSFVGRACIPCNWQFRNCSEPRHRTLVRHFTIHALSSISQTQHGWSAHVALHPSDLYIQFSGPSRHASVQSFLRRILLGPRGPPDGSCDAILGDFAEFLRKVCELSEKCELCEMCELCD
jgi:hypothetical protein